MSDQVNSPALHHSRKHYVVGITPRCLSIEQSAFYLSVGPDTIRRFFWEGPLHQVIYGDGRRIFVDIRELDACVDRSKLRDHQTIGHDATESPADLRSDRWWRP